MDYETEIDPNKVVKLVFGVIILLVAVVCLFGSFGTVGAGEQGVKLRFGAVTGDVVDEGLYFKLPFIEKIVKMDVQIRKAETDADSASRDLQSLDTRVALNFHLNASKVATIYKEVRNDYVERIVAPAIQEAVKAGTAQYTAEEVITKRSEVRDTIKVLLKEKLEPRGIIVDDFNIVNFDFSESFNNAIEAKVTAEQDALAAKNKLEQIKFEAQQKIEAAKGSAEAIRIEANALRSNPAVLELRAIEKWNGIMPQVTGGAVPFVNIK